MKTKRFKINVEVLSKVNGKHYVITNVSGSAAYAKVVLEKDKATKEPVLGEENITLTKDNAICFKIWHDPNPKDVPDVDEYSLDNKGQLLNDGAKVCRQGEIVIEKILGAIPLKLILLVKGNTEGVFLIKSFFPAENKFENMLILNSDKAPDVWKLESGDYALIYSKTKTIPATEAEPEKTIFKESAVAFIDDRGGVKEVHLPVPVDAVGAGANGTLFFNCSKQVNENGVLEDAAPFTLMVDKTGYTELALEGITSARPFFINAGGFVVKNNDILIVINKDGEELYRIRDLEAVEELHNYCFLIDEKCEGDTETLLFANNKYQMKKCVVVHTSDRGDIVDVTDYVAEE